MRGAKLASTDGASAFIDSAIHRNVVDAVEYDGKSDVFDLTVPEYGNFAVNSGIFVHNCDATEADKYLINGVWVSNFVTPCYFEPPSSLVGVKLDYMGLIKAPYEIRPGGYNQYWLNGWRMVQNNSVAPRSYRQAVHGRGALRRRGFRGE